MELTGTIVPGDHDAILRQFEPHTPIPGLTPILASQASISLNSEGGSVSEALKIGRMLRDRQFIATVSFKRKCLSSCVFVLMGAVDRRVLGSVGVHRPYFGNFLPGASPKQVADEFDVMKERLYGYAREMRVPAALIDLMYSIGPEKMLILEDEQLTLYGLNRIDPVFEEIEIMKESRWYEVTPVEYRLRLRRVEAICDPLVEDADPYAWSECYSATRLGLSVEQYRERRPLFLELLDDTWSDEQKRQCYLAIMVRGQNAC